MNLSFQTSESTKSAIFTCKQFSFISSLCSTLRTKKTPLAISDIGCYHYQQTGLTDRADAMFALATHCLYGKHNSTVDCPRAKAYLARAVNAGNVNAMNELAYLLHKMANGVPRDPLQAKLLHRLVIKRGNLGTVTKLASLLAEGATNAPTEHTRAKQRMLSMPVTLVL